MHNECIWQIKSCIQKRRIVTLLCTIPLCYKNFMEKINYIHLEEGQTITAYCSFHLNVVRYFLTMDTTLKERTKLSPDQDCSQLELCSNTTYSVHNDNFIDSALGVPWVHQFLQSSWTFSWNIFNAKRALESYAATHWF